MKIRKATKKDRKRCNKIIYDCIQKVRIRKKMKEFLKKRYTPDGINKLSKKCYIIVGEKFGSVQGSGMLCKNEIGMMYVNPIYHKRRIGREIMINLERLAKKKKLNKIYVNALVPAKGFYKKLGYKSKGKKSDKDIYVMEKKLG